MKFSEPKNKIVRGVSPLALCPTNKTILSTRLISIVSKPNMIVVVVVVIHVVFVKKKLDKKMLVQKKSMSEKL